jgi:serine/threonine-protein kinase RsbW
VTEPQVPDPNVVPLPRLTSRNSATLEFSADPELWTIARLVVSTLASRLDFEIDALDDLRLATDELCTLCASGATVEDRLQLTFGWGADYVEVACEVYLPGARSEDAESAGESGWSTLELSRRILRALVDDFDIAPIEDETRRGRFRKSRTSAQ